MSLRSAAIGAMGRRQAAFEHIDRYKILRSLGGVGINAFDCRFSPGRSYPINSMRIVDDPRNPLYKQTKRRWLARTEPLWWNCLCQPRAGTSMTRRVIRSWLSRRLRQSFVESLRKHGFDVAGRRFPSGATGKEMYGTVQLTPRPSMMTASPEILQNQTDHAVRLLIAQLVGQEEDRRNVVRVAAAKERPNSTILRNNSRRKGAIKST